MTENDRDRILRTLKEAYNAISLCKIDAYCSKDFMDVDDFEVIQRLLLYTREHVKALYIKKPPKLKGGILGVLHAKPS